MTSREHPGRRRARTVLLFSGLLLILSAFAHTFGGLPPIRAGLLETHASDLVLPVTIGWLFGSAAMLAFGVIVLVAWHRLGQGRKGGLPAVAAISVLYLVFGVAAFVYTHYHTHFIGFIVLGLLLGVGWNGARSSA